MRLGTIAIERNPHRCQQQQYDLIIVGGGIYGAMLAVQATARNLRPLLVERGDFGGNTSFNSLRIIHGGLRYLQSFDMPRYFESVRERRWFLSEFAEFVRPLSCLMPLYGQGLKRNSILRAALAINEVLSASRNRGVPESNWLPCGRVMGVRETVDLFPTVSRTGLRGAALWYDAALADSPRVLMESLNWAAAFGADLLNYTEADGLVVDAGEVTGLKVVDRLTGERHVFSAPVVINSTGPWSDGTVARLGATGQQSFSPSLAWNIWLDDDAPSECALAVTPRRQGAPTYFLHPWKGRLLVGTGHVPWAGPPDDPVPTADQVQTMLNDLNMAIPGLDLKAARIRRIFAGLLPARRAGSNELSVRPIFTDHGDARGARGLYTVLGVKFTTARYVAAWALDRIFGGSGDPGSEFRRPAARTGWRLSDLDVHDVRARDQAVEGVKSLIADESVMHLSDLIVRRTDLWEAPSAARSLAPLICDLFPWDAERRQRELAQVEHELDYANT